jgi:hypothetical protein
MTPLYPIFRPGQAFLPDPRELRRAELLGTRCPLIKHGYVIFLDIDSKATARRVFFDHRNELS